MIAYSTIDWPLRVAWLRNHCLIVCVLGPPRLGIPLHHLTRRAVSARVTKAGPPSAVLELCPSRYQADLASELTVCPHRFLVTPQPGALGLGVAHRRRLRDARKGRPDQDGRGAGH